MQAIVTKFIPCTNTLGSRIKAICDGGSVTISADSALNSEDCHTAAALALVRKLGWDAECYGGVMQRGGMPSASPYAYVFVFTGGRVAEQDRIKVTR